MKYQLYIKIILFNYLKKNIYRKKDLKLILTIYYL